jgi:hypothetical protein
LKITNMKIKRTTNMKIKKRTRLICCAAVLSTAFLLALAPASRAANLIYTVTLYTSSLDSNPDAPFSLDLQLLTGSGNPTTGAGNVSNTVTLSNFTFLGGSASGTPNFTAGGESGSLAGGLTLTNSSGNNEFAEAFSSSVTSITFKVNETLNTEVVGSGLPTPDTFSVFIDDNNTADGFVPTTAPGGADALVISELVSGDTFSSVGFYDSTSSPDPGVVAVPEPGSTGMLCLGGTILAIWVRRKTSRVCA